jgi:hypothetical protein
MHVPNDLLTMKKLLFILLAFTGGNVHAAAAQGLPASESSTACARHERLVVQGGTPQEVTAALRRMPYCGADVWGRSVAGAVSRLRRSADPVDLERFWRASAWVADARILAVSLDIAGDKTASLTARLHALRALLMVGRPDLWPELQGMRTPGARDVAQQGCHFSRRAGEFPHRGTPFPTDATARILAVARALQRDQSQPAAIRGAAQCVVAQVQARA